MKRLAAKYAGYALTVLASAVVFTASWVYVHRAEPPEELLRK